MFASVASGLDYRLGRMRFLRARGRSKPSTNTATTREAAEGDDTFVCDPMAVFTSYVAPYVTPTAEMSISCRTRAPSAHPASERLEWCKQAAGRCLRRRCLGLRRKSGG